MDNGILSELQAAKAIEYLIALAFLASFVPFWRYTARRFERRAEAPARADAPAFAPTVPATVAVAAGPSWPEPSGWFHVPEGFGLHPGHAWAKAVGPNEVLVGADDFARAAVGRVHDVDLPPVGSIVRQGEPGFALRGAAGPLPMISPVDGMVVATNPSARVGAFETDPYGEGWLLKVEAPRFRTNAKQLLSGSAARAWMEDVARRLRGVIAPDLGPVLADGGVPVSGIAGEVGPEIWKTIAREFFFVDGDERGGTTAAPRA